MRRKTLTADIDPRHPVKGGGGFCVLMEKSGNFPLTASPDNVKVRHMTNTDTDTISIGRAALILGVSTKTVQRWEQMGRLSLAGRSEGGHRRYVLADVERLAAERSAA